MQNPTERARRFVRFGSEVVIGLYEPDGRTVGEFVVRWKPREDDAPVACLEAFHEAWAAFAVLPDLMRALSVLAMYPAREVSTDALISVLEALGFVDGAAAHAAGK